MKKALVVVVGLSMLLSTWCVLTDTPRVYAIESGDVKTVTLRIEGMT